MPTSAIIDGKVLDFHFKVSDYVHNFYVGDLFMGQIFKVEAREWSAVPFKAEQGVLTLVDGFNSRYSAAEYILKAKGVWRS